MLGDFLCLVLVKSGDKSIFRKAEPKLCLTLLYTLVKVTSHWDCDTQNSINVCWNSTTFSHGWHFIPLAFQDIFGCSYVTLTRSYHFLFGQKLVCHGGTSSGSVKAALQPGCIAWWGKQGFGTGGALSSKCQCVSVADNWASFVLLSVARSYWSLATSDLVIWQ